MDFLNTAFFQQIFLDNPLKSWAYFTLAVLLIILLNRVLGKLFSFILYRIFRRFTVDSRINDFDRLMVRPLATFFVFFIIYLAFNILEYPDVLDVSVYEINLSEVLQMIYRALLAFLFMWVMLRMVDFISMVLAERAALTTTKSDDQVVLFVRDLLKVLVVFFVIFFVLGVILRLNITSLLAGAGIAGLAIAFAAQESIANLFGSFAIFFDKPFTIGDLVQVEGIIGTVEKVGFRSTRIRTLEKTFVTVPNRKLVENNSENLTLRTFRRMKTVIGVLYGTKKEVLQKIVSDIQDYIDGHENTTEEGIVSFNEFGDSSLNIMVLYYIKELDYNKFLKVVEDINYKIMDIVQTAGSDFAFPTRTVHMQHETPLQINQLNTP